MSGFRRGGAALCFAALSISLLSASIYPTIVWYEDVEVQKATNAGGQPVVLSVTWQATISQWCSVGNSMLSTTAGPASVIQAFCWNLQGSGGLTAASLNPNNDPNLQQFLENSEISDAANAIQHGSLLTYIAIGIGLAGLSFLMCCMGLALGWNHRLNPYTLLTMARLVGFCGFVAPFVAVWIYLGAINSAGSDATLSLSSQTSWQYIGPWGLTTGYWLLVSGAAFSLLACCFTVFTCADTLDPETNFGRDPEPDIDIGDDAQEGASSVAVESGHEEGGSGKGRHLKPGYIPQYADLPATQTTTEFLSQHQRAGGNAALPGNAAPAAAAGFNSPQPAHSGPAAAGMMNGRNWHYHNGPNPAVAAANANVAAANRGVGVGYANNGRGGQAAIPAAAPVVIPMPRVIAQELYKAAGGKVVPPPQTQTLTPVGSFFRVPKPKPAATVASPPAAKGSSSSSSSASAAASSLSYANAVKR